MTLMERTFMGAETQDTSRETCLARAISAALASRYPHHTAKYVAQDLDCTPKAAANLLEGHLSAASIGRVITAYGPGWLAERVLEAGGLTLESYIDHQAAEAERAAAQALECAKEARTRYAKYQAARRCRARDDGAHP